MKVQSKKASLIPKNSRTFCITPGYEATTPIYIDGSIMVLDTGEYTITCGDTVTVQRKPYKVNKIEKMVIGKRIVYHLSVADLNKSTMFIFPMLGGHRNLFLFDTLFVNCFIGADKYENNIILLYRFSGTGAFLKFEQELKKSEGYIDCFDPSPYFVAFVFEIPEIYKDDYVCFLNGEYSKFNSAYKNNILDFHGFDINGELAQILYKAEKRRTKLQETLGIKLEPDAELYSIMDEEEEIFKAEIYI